MTRLYTISSTKPQAVVHFDWLTVVFPIGATESERYGQTVESYIESVLSNYGLSQADLFYSHLKNGLYFYENAITTGNNSIIVAWYTPNEKQVLTEGRDNFCLQMSGAGVETLESVLDKIGLTVADFIKNAVDDFGATFSRVDACNNFFNYGKEYSAKYIDEQCSAGNLVSRTSSVRAIRKYNSTGEDKDLSSYIGPNQGYTTYIGKNPKQLRVYNKLAERSDKVNLRYQVKSWSRWEFQLNGKQAQAFIENYLSRNCNLSQTWVDWLATSYRFIERVGHQAKRARYPTASWYERVIRTAKSETIVRTEKQKPTFEKASHWIDKQVMPTLATIFQARVSKYVKNGVSYKDARNLALEKVLHDIDDKLVNNEIDYRKVSTWLVEQED